MANYTEWNKAVAAYFTANVPRGASVFLTVNDESLEDIAANFLNAALTSGSAATDFVTAVRTQIVDSGKVSLDNIGAISTDKLPKGVGFLGLMVLAAHRMAGEEGIDPINYFLRLTQQLEVPTGIGNRPAGLGTAKEEPLWILWNSYLQANGWQSTAMPGCEGPRKYINYVLTQALLRDDDISYLQNKFRENLGGGGVSRTMDEVQLAGWLQRTNAITRRYLREGFNNSDQRRAAGFYEAAYRAYEATQWAGGPAPLSSQRSRVINAGLIRPVSIAGQVAYKMFVLQPTNWKPKPVSIANPSGTVVRLIPGRSGHFQPLWNQQPFVPESVRHTLQGDPLLDAVVFPSRDFWVLTPDPEDQTGALATWEKFPNLLGQKFTLICPTAGDQNVQEEMDRFRQAKLIDWVGEPASTLEGSCHEYRGCMVLSSAWEGFVPSEKCPDLYETLKPRNFANISLAGGIRAPDQNAWLVGYPPAITLYGFEQQFGLRLVSGDSEILSTKQNRQEQLQLDRELPSGMYTLEVDWNGQLLSSRSFRLIDWEAMDNSPHESDAKLTVQSSGGLLTICGAGIEKLNQPLNREAAHA